MTSLVFVASLLAQAAGPLAQAESLFAASDSVAGVAALGVLLDDERQDVGLTAALALAWIGRDARWREADQRVRKLRPRQTRDGHPAARLLPIARALHVGDRRALDSAALAISRALLESAPPESLLAGAGAWVASLQSLALLEARLPDAIPTAGRLRGCPFHRASACVRLAGSSESSGLPLGEIVRRDPALTALKDAARATLLRQLQAPWPYPDLAAQVLLALEVLFGDSASHQVARAAIDSAPMSPRARHPIQAALLAFAGDRGGAQDLMARHPEWFSPLDARTEALGQLPALDPAITWRVAWALYLEPVNERQVVHRARLLASGPIARALPRVGRLLWLESDSSLLVRYGLPAGVARRDVQSRPGPGEVPLVIYLDPRTRETLLRTTGVIAAGSPGGAGPHRPALDLGLAARDTVPLSGPSGYVDDHFDTFGPLDHQVAQYFREDEPLVELYVTRPAPRCDTPEKARRKAEQLSGRGPRPVMGFFLLDDRLGLVRRAVDSVLLGTPERYTYQVKPTPGVYVYSVEHVDPACRHAARARYVVVVRDLGEGMALSDLVLSAERRVDGAARVAGLPRPSALGRLTVSVSEPLHLYWEVYGVPADAVDAERFDVAVEVLDLGGRRVGAREVADVARAIDDAPRSLNMRYRAPIVRGEHPLALGLSIELPPGSEGLHFVRVNMRDLHTGQRAAAQRAVFVTAP